VGSEQPALFCAVLGLKTRSGAEKAMVTTLFSPKTESTLVTEATGQLSDHAACRCGKASPLAFLGVWARSARVTGEALRAPLNAIDRSRVAFLHCGLERRRVGVDRVGVAIAGPEVPVYGAAGPEGRVREVG
jgi:hypothetical protein